VHFSACAPRFRARPGGRLSTLTRLARHCAAANHKDKKHAQFVHSPRDGNVIDVQALVAPISDDAPSGPDLEYDPEFIELEAVSRGKSEQQFGDTVIPAEEPEWRDVTSRAASLLARSKDLRVAVLAARAAIHMDQIQGLAAGLELVNEMTQRYWDTLHPDLDHDDNDDPTMRLNALAPLADAETFLRDVRGVYVVASPQHGRVAVRDILIAENKLPPGADETPMSATQIAGIALAVAAENPEPLQAALACLEHLKALESLLSDKGVLSQAPDLHPLRDMLQSAAKVAADALRAVGGEAGGEGEAGESGEAGEGAPRRISGQIQTREDAIRVLETVCKFIEQSEPSNPAPLLIRRAQRLMSRNFMEIIEDLAPESVAQIKKLAGLEEL
jgi:type VI secretion system protein ImpA